jgi:hypothetical protein
MGIVALKSEADGSGCHSLAKMVGSHWEHLCTPLDHDSLAPIQEDQKVDSLTCLSVGICICKGSGIVLRSMRNAFINAMKKILPPKSQGRTLLQNGFIIVRLESSPAAACVIGPQPQPEECLAAHVGMQYLSPFRPTYQVLRCVHTEDGTLAVGDRVFFQAAPSAYTRVKQCSPALAACGPC